MRVIIIGNGLGGTIAAKTLLEMDQKVEIDIFADEKYHYYSRPNLIEFIAGNLPILRSGITSKRLKSTSKNL